MNKVLRIYSELDYIELNTVDTCVVVPMFKGAVWDCLSIILASLNL